MTAATAKSAAAEESLPGGIRGETDARDCDL